MPHPHLHHQSRRTGCLAALTAATLALSLVGCSPSDNDPHEPTQSSTGAPEGLPFESEAEAIEQARATYQNYLRVADEIMHDGGEQPNRIDEFAVDEAREAVHQGASYLSTNDKTYEGWSRVDELSITHYEVNKTRKLSARVCTDVSDVEVYDSSGSSTVADDRAPEMIFALDFKVTASGNLVLTHREVVANSCD